MEILGIGPSELVFIIIIALIVLGPKDMQKAGKTIGRWLNDLVRSDGWKAFQQTSREVRNLPTKLMRDANMELAETEKALNKVMDDKPASPLPSSPTSTSSAQRLRTTQSLPLPQQTNNSIQPPSATPTTDSDSNTNETTS